MHRLRHQTASFSVAALLFMPVGLSRAQVSSAPHVQAIRFWSFGDVTRVAIQTEGEYRLKSDRIASPPRLYFDLNGLRPPATARHGFQTIQVGDRRVKQIRVAQLSSASTRIVFDLGAQVEVVSSQLVNPDRLMIEIRPKGTSVAALNTPVIVGQQQQAPRPYIPPPLPVTVPANPVAANVPTPPPPSFPTGADHSLVRLFGLKLGKVVIDPGHGGHDTGTIGPKGLLEKDLVLDIARRLGARIRSQLGAEVVFTRSDDVFIPLEDRTKLANDQKADLFLSIHANSSPESSATGVETYYFNFTSDQRGLNLATRENATATSSISDLNDLLHRAVLQTKLEESREFALRVQTSLSGMSFKMNGKSKDRGVRQAPFVVLIGATMPSILAEVGFVSNPHDERLMEKSEQRQKIAEALFKGVSVYASSLSHVQMARASSR